MIGTPEFLLLLDARFYLNNMIFLFGIVLTEIRMELHHVLPIVQTGMAKPGLQLTCFLLALHLLPNFAASAERHGSHKILVYTFQCRSRGVRLRSTRNDPLESRADRIFVGLWPPPCHDRIAIKAKAKTSQQSTPSLLCSLHSR